MIYMEYLKYNHEERNLCAHLFRVLHEPCNDYQILREFIGEETSFTNFHIFVEVGLIWDAFQQRRYNENQFMNDLIHLIMHQEQINKCKLYSQLDQRLKYPQTHPRQIRQKARQLNYALTQEEIIVYEALQVMFNTKPYLAIILDDRFVVYEIKLERPFHEEQLKRIEKIAQVWAELLYKDLGYSAAPTYKVLKIGKYRLHPDISWEKIEAMVGKVMPEDDKSLLAIREAVRR